MINLSLEHLLNEESEIIVRPYQYSYEELLDLIEDYDNELLFKSFEEFCTLLEDGIDKWHNVFTINDYINIHGVDNAIKELVGEEGIVSNVKDAIVTFAKWLWGKLVDFVNWIKRLFESKDTSPISVDDIKKPIVFVKKATASPTNVEEVKKIIKKLDLSKKDNIKVKCDIEKIQSLVKDTTFPQNAMWDYEEAKTNLEHVKEILNILNSSFEEKELSRVTAANAFLISVSFISKCRSVSLGILHVLNGIVSKKLPDNLTEEEAKQYIQKITSALNIKNENEINTNNLKEYLKAMRETCGMAIRLDNAFVKHGVSIVTQLSYVGGDDESSLFVSDSNLSSLVTSNLAGIDFTESIPAQIQKKLNDAWKRKFKVQRIIISNVRGVGTVGTKIGMIGSNTAHVGLPNVEIYMTPGFFVKKLGLFHKFKQLEIHLKNTRQKIPDILKQIIDENYDRVEVFMKIMVHELRHTWQSQTGFKYGKVIIPGVNGTQEEYEASAHEVDAREASENYKVDEVDRQWVRKLIFKMIQQARKHRSTVKSVQKK